MAAKKLTRKEKARLQAPAAEAKAREQESTAASLKLANRLALIVAAAGFLLYANTLNHDYALDDYSVIKENRLTRQGWDAFPEILIKSYRFGYYFVSDELYRPVPKAMFAAEWALWPDNPVPGHWINVLLYALTGFLLFRVLFAYSGGKHLLPFVVSLLFIAHPIHTEVVANIKSRDELLSLLFFLGSLAWIHRYATKGQPLALAGAAVLFILSLLSKESGITFVAVYPLWLYFFSTGNGSLRIRIALTLTGAAAVFLLIRNSVLAMNLKESFALADNLLMGIHDPAARFATAVHILGIYLKQLLYPHPLVFDKSFNQIEPVQLTDPGFIIPFILLAGLAVWAVIRFRNKEVYVFGMLFFLVTVSIFSNIAVIIGTSYGERLMYIPSLGFALAAGFFIGRLGKQHPADISGLAKFFRSRPAALAVCGLVAGAYAFKTVTRNPVWKNNWTLFSSDVNLSPNSTRTHFYLGNYMTRPENLGVEPADSIRMEQVLDSGIVELKKALAIYDGFCDVYKQLGVAYGKKKDLRAAFEHYRKAIECNPGDAPSHSNIGTIYFEQGDYEQALKAFRQAVAIDPNYTESLLNLGSTYGMIKDYPNAIHYLQRCIETDPGYTQAYYFMSITYGFMGDRVNADRYLLEFRQRGGKI